MSVVDVVVASCGGGSNADVEASERSSHPDVMSSEADEGVGTNLADV